jgi:hypothetical protein
MLADEVAAEMIRKASYALLSRSIIMHSFLSFFDFAVILRRLSFDPHRASA